MVTEEKKKTIAGNRREIHNGRRVERGAVVEGHNVFVSSLYKVE